MSEAKKSGITYKSCFKTLLVKFLQAEGNMAQMPAKYRSSIKCFVKESQPHFLITDGHFFIAGHFTKEAIDSFKAKYKSHPMESLKGFLINIERWTLELALVDSTKAFTSYANLEFRLVIHSFSLASTTKQELENKHPQNLFRDDDCRTYIQEFLHNQQQAIIKGNTPALEFGSTGAVCLDPKSTDAYEFRNYKFLSRTKSEVVGGKAAPIAEDEDNLAKISKRKPSVKKSTTVNVKKGSVSTKVVK